MRRIRYLAIGVVLVAITREGNSIAATAAGTASDFPISVNGSEQIAWEQVVAQGNDLSGYVYVGYVDSAPVILDAGCQRVFTTVVTCTAKLPSMTPGAHRIEIKAIDAGLESSRSSPIYVVMAGPQIESPPRGNGADDHVLATSDGQRVFVETVATGLDNPSALAATPDGRVFIAQASGTVSVWQGRLLSTPAVRLSEVQRVPGIGLIGMTLHPEFATNGLLFIAYVGRSGNGALVNRIARFRDFNGSFGEGIVILEDFVDVVAPRPPRIRFGPGKKLYVAFQAADWSAADSYASYAGKVLRLNEDGTTPRDNPGASPIMSSGHIATGGFDWHADGGGLWLTERDRQGRDVLRSLSSEFEEATVASFASVVDASGAAFYPAIGRLSAFRSDLFVTGLVGQQLRRVRFNPRDPSRIDSTERLLEGQYGRLSDVIAGPDGVLYVSTSNRGVASSTADDDRLLRLSPATP